jgi:hypothetical protein
MSHLQSQCCLFYIQLIGGLVFLSLSGDPVTGDPVAGDPVAGDPVAGDLVTR